MGFYLDTTTGNGPYLTTGIFNPNNNYYPAGVSIQSNLNVIRGNTISGVYNGVNHRVGHRVDDVHERLRDQLHPGKQHRHRPDGHDDRQLWQPGRTASSSRSAPGRTGSAPTTSSRGTDPSGSNCSIPPLRGTSSSGTGSVRTGRGRPRSATVSSASSSPTARAETPWAARPAGMSSPAMLWAGSSLGTGAWPGRHGQLGPVQHHRTERQPDRRHRDAGYRHQHRPRLGPQRDRGECPGGPSRAWHFPVEHGLELHLGELARPDPRMGSGSPTEDTGSP